jgi:hypothetical protein
MSARDTALTDYVFRVQALGGGVGFERATECGDHVGPAGVCSSRAGSGRSSATETTARLLTQCMAIGQVPAGLRSDSDGSEGGQPQGSASGSASEREAMSHPAESSLSSTGPLCAVLSPRLSSEADIPMHALGAAPATS